MVTQQQNPQDQESDLFAVSNKPQQITADELAAVDAAQEDVDRYYRDNPDAEQIDVRLNNDLRRRAAGSAPPASPEDACD